MVKAEVRYTGEHFKAVAKALQLKISQKIFIGAFLVFCAAASGWLLSKCIMFFRSRNDDFAMLYAIMFVLVFTTFLKILKAVAGAAGSYSKVKPSEQMRYFEIDENTLRLTVVGDIEHSERVFKLPGIHHAADTGDHFVIYMYKNMYCMLAYKDITEGTPEQLRTLLYNAIGDKFTIR